MSNNKMTPGQLRLSSAATAVVEAGKKFFGAGQRPASHEDDPESNLLGVGGPSLSGYDHNETNEEVYRAV